MRIFGLEITFSPATANDSVVWNARHRYISRIGDLTPTELRAELARVHELARTGRWYWINCADRTQQLHEVTTVLEHTAHQEIEQRQLAHGVQRHAYDRNQARPRPADRLLDRLELVQQGLL